MSTDKSIEEIKAVTQTAQAILRRRIEGIEQSRGAQPERLAKARSDADEARGWALIEEPFHEQLTAIRAVDGPTALALPNFTAKELWGARLAFDLLDAGEDFDQVDTVMSRLFATVNGDTGLAFLITSAALSTIASLVVPQLLDEIEQSGSNYDVRVGLAEARARAWHGRLAELREDGSTGAGEGAL